MSEQCDKIGLLIDWLRKRAMPDSGIHYKSDHFDTGAYVELHGQDAKFVASHFHGAGATQLADALEKIAALASPQVERYTWMKPIGGGTMLPHARPDGGWVLYSDHLAVVKKLEEEANHWHEEAQSLLSHCETAESTIQALTKRVEAMQEALKPFAGEKLPGNNRDLRDYNRFGLRCMMSPMEIARRDAFFALHPEEHPLAKQAALQPSEPGEGKP